MIVGTGGGSRFLCELSIEKVEIGIPVVNRRVCKDVLETRSMLGGCGKGC